MLTCGDDPCADNATCLPSSDGRSYTCQCPPSPPEVVLGPDCYPLPQTLSTASTSSYSILASRRFLHVKLNLKVNSNSQAPLINSADHITDALASLHWLRVTERIEYKVAVLTYRVLNGSAPRYLGPLVPVADLPGRWTLRSAGTNRLLVPPVRL